ncbi:MAG: GNAT family N-acetyltransferase [Faecousia sp.]
MNIRLCKMTKILSRQFFQGFTSDPDLFSEMSRFSEYVYCEADVDARWERQQRLCRIHLAVMLEEEPVGEVIFKDVNAGKGTLSIHMKNDHVKNHGYGTKAEILALEYALDVLELETVFADAIHKNKRSQHVLEKVGFLKTHSDEQFVYYRCDKVSWERPEARKAELP